MSASVNEINELTEIDRLLAVHSPAHPAVVEAMVRIYRNAVYRLALSILDDADEAEDATQETFIKAAQNLGRYTTGTNFRAWIFQIDVNTCRSLLRKRAARANLNRLLHWQARLTSNPPEPEQVLDQKRRENRLWDLVAKLPEKQRMVVILHLGHDLPVAEVAQVLETTPKTIYSRLYAAYAALKALISQTGNHELYEYMK